MHSIVLPPAARGLPDGASCISEVLFGSMEGRELGSELARLQLAEKPTQGPDLWGVPSNSIHVIEGTQDVMSQK